MLRNDVFSLINSEYCLFVCECDQQKALELVGFSAEDIINILRIVAAVLKLGNLIFSPVSNIDGTEGCSINNEYGTTIPPSAENIKKIQQKQIFVNKNFGPIELEEVATLLLIPVEDLRSALLYRTYSVSCSIDAHNMVASGGGGVASNCFSRDSTLPRGESAIARTFLTNNHQQLLLQQRTSLLSTSASMVGGRGTILKL